MSEKKRHRTLAWLERQIQIEAGKEFDKWFQKQEKKDEKEQDKNKEQK